MDPGQPDSYRKNKFGKMTGSSATSSKRRYDPYITDKNFAFGYAEDQRIFREALQTKQQFQNTAAEIIKLRQSKTDNDEKFDCDSFSHSTYLNPKTIKTNVGCVDPNDFLDAFHQYTGSGDFCDAVHVNDIQKIITSVMGEKTPTWIVQKIAKLCRNKSSFGYISWEDFRIIISTAQEVISYDCDTIGRNIPSWLQPKLKDESVLNEYFPKSSYTVNFNANRLRDVKIDDSYNPTKTGTTRFLFQGTTKYTDQLPGYCGHIPCNTANLRKELHSGGMKPRPQTCDLRLISERLGSVPGYTGHIPVHTGLDKDRTTGMDPLTTSGQAFGFYYKYHNQQ